LPNCQCPECGAATPYTLADGRLQCRKCRKRFRPPKSVWDSLRLDADVRDKLLDMVVEGLPTNSPDVRDLSNRPTRDRFSRIARACYAHAVKLRSPIGPCVPVADEPGVDPRHWPRGRRAPRSAVVFELSERRRRAQVKLVDSKRSADVWRDIASQAGPGSPCFQDERHAYVWLAVQGERVAIPKSRRPQKGGPRASAVVGIGTSETVEEMPESSRDLIEKFWNYFERRLRSHKSVARKDLHLYLGEACYRFKTRRRRVGRKMMLVELMKKSALLDIQGVLSQ